MIESGGAAGSRTLVQSSEPEAFYMLILPLIVGVDQAGGLARFSLSSLVSYRWSGADRRPAAYE